MQPTLHTPLWMDDNATQKCEQVHYGMTIMMVLIGIAGGFLLGFYCSGGLVAAACKNMTR